MFYNRLKDNPLKSRADLLRAVDDLIEPLLQFRNQSGSQINKNSIGVHYQDPAVGLEGFARALYGMVPAVLAHSSKTDLYLDWIVNGIKAGVSDKHPERWPDPFFYETSFIEMGSIAVAFLSLPEKSLNRLNDQDRQSLARWFLSTQYFDDFKNNNQQFFRLFSYLAVKKLDPSLLAPHQISDVLDKIDLSYRGDGWYNDGLATEKRRSVDYYNSMGFHFYGLLYSRFCGDENDEFVTKFHSRAKLFAKDFLHWFDQSGRGIPFGRSLVYRCAQSSFWSALAFADVEALPWGQIKSLILKNLRYWFSQPIFTESGCLSVGYRYPNLNMAEEYNSELSPYWAFKPFVILGLPADHAFWQCEEAPVEKPQPLSVQKQGRHILCETKESGHLVMLNGGNWRKSCFQHIEAKNSKFAYSSHFGFNVSTGNGRVDKRAPDNTLLLTDDGYYFKERGETFDHEVSDSYLASSFTPWEDVTIRTWMTFLGQGSWHLRVHRVESERELVFFEGGFPLPRSEAHYMGYHREQPGEYFGSIDKQERKGLALIAENTGLSGLSDPREGRQGQVVLHAPNSNVLHRRAVIPTLKGKIKKGTSLFLTLVTAHPSRSHGEKLWQSRPDLDQIRKELSSELVASLVEGEINL